jgi:hypothetical protein
LAAAAQELEAQFRNADEAAAARRQQVFAAADLRARAGDRAGAGADRANPGATATPPAAATDGTGESDAATTAVGNNVPATNNQSSSTPSSAAGSAGAATKPARAIGTTKSPDFMGTGAATTAASMEPFETFEPLSAERENEKAARKAAANTISNKSAYRGAAAAYKHPPHRAGIEEEEEEEEDATEMKTQHTNGGVRLPAFFVVCRGGDHRQLAALEGTSSSIQATVRDRPAVTAPIIRTIKVVRC